MNFDNNYPVANRGKVIVWGLLSAFPFGGMVWQVLHHIVGFRRLGFDVWYVEDSDRNLLDPITWMPTSDFKANIDLLSVMMERVGLKDRWIFRVPKTEICHGATNFEGLMRLYKEAEVVFNLCNGQELLPYHDNIECLVCLETDPGTPQIKVASGHQRLIASYKRYKYIFTYGENIGNPDCLLPTEQFKWLPTRPPVITDWWAGCNYSNRKNVTTIANWDTKDDGIEWKGVKYYWQKDFTRFIDLPLKINVPLGLALVRLKEANKDMLVKNNWVVFSGFDLSDYIKYHDFISNSLGEFTVAKDIYVKLNTGWFSDRSVCYLAAGSPVITEETGFSKFVPNGEGLFGFSNENEILNALEAIKNNIEKQSRKAREIAEEYYKAEKVLTRILKTIKLL